MAKRISKQEIIDQIYKDVKGDTRITKKEAKHIVDKLIEKIVENVKEDNQVSFLGFGTFRLKKVNEKEGINPQTGKKITIPAYKTIAFKASSKVKESL